MEFKQFLSYAVNLVEHELSRCMPPKHKYSGIIVEAMEYSLFAGGKRLRPVLVILGNQAVGGNIETAIPISCAVEMIHTYSLIHDDLPAMDNDDYRRGKLTNHKVYGEAMAILAGDGLLTHSFVILSSELNKFLSPDQVVSIIREIAESSGCSGMVGGQVADLMAEGRQLSEDELNYIHSRKTGALIIAALRAGALSGGANDQQLDCLTRYGKKIGLAYQIIDDILDVVGDEQKIGKKLGSDLKNKKFTYPDIFGLKRSRQMAQELIKEAKEEVVKQFGEAGNYLSELANYLGDREY